MKSESKELMNDLSKLLKEEGSYVKELTDIATKAAGFHARLESIEKALEKDPSCYCKKEADQMVQKAEDKYSNELENNMKEHAKSEIKAE
ncbi:MAG: hypothetical protein E7256_10520 [Lachnospiraceae bacterium]|nr:hypothetical protein [Lachnospiraceae bacterium]